MKPSKDGKATFCHIFFGEWQAVKPRCMKMLAGIFPGLSEDEISILHGDEVTEANIVEALRTKGLFVSRTIVIYQEPDFLRAKGRADDISKRLEKALESNNEERVVKLLARLMAREDVSVSELKSATKQAIGRLALPKGIDMKGLLEMVERFQDRLEQLRKEPLESSGERILQWLRSGIEKKGRQNVFLCLSVERPDRRRKELKQFLKLCPFTDLSGGSEGHGKKTVFLQTQVKNWVKEAGKQISPEALKHLMELVGDRSISALKNEAEKLISLSGQRKIIGLEDVKGLVIRHREEEIFKIGDAIRRRDIGAALKSSRLLLEQGIHPLAVLSAVRNCLLRILALKVAVAASGFEHQVEKSSYTLFKDKFWQSLKSLLEPYGWNPLGNLHPYGAWLNITSSGNYSLHELFDMLEEMAEMDLSLKGGKVSPELVIENFFMKNL